MLCVYGDANSNLVAFNQLVGAVHVGVMGRVQRCVAERVVIVDRHGHLVVDVLDDLERVVYNVVLNDLAILVFEEDLCFLLVEACYRRQVRDLLKLRPLNSDTRARDAEPWLFSSTRYVHLHDCLLVEGELKLETGCLLVVWSRIG